MKAPVDVAVDGPLILLDLRVRELTEAFRSRFSPPAFTSDVEPLRERHVGVDTDARDAIARADPCGELGVRGQEWRSSDPRGVGESPRASADQQARRVGVGEGQQLLERDLLRPRRVRQRRALGGHGPVALGRLSTLGRPHDQHPQQQREHAQTTIGNRSSRHR